LAGIGFCGHYPSVLPVDKYGNALSPAFIWMDERGKSECKKIQSLLKGAKVRSNRNELRGYHPIPKIIWLKKNLPNVFNRTYKFVQATTYLNHRLTGRIAIDPTNASWFHSFDYESKNWSDEICEILSVSSSMHPDVLSASTVLGKVCKSASKETGIPLGCPVIVGTGDDVAAALGTGIIKIGQAYMTTGTGGCIFVLTDKPVFAKGMVTEAYVNEDQWLIGGIIKNIGSSLNWFLRQFGYNEKIVGRFTGLNPFTFIEEEASQSIAGSKGLIFLPYLDGAIQNPDAQAVLFGMNLSTSRADVIRSIMEGVAYTLKDNINAIEKTGQKIKEIRVTGAPISSKIWSTIFADVIQRQILIPEEPEATPRGVALLVGKALGLWNDHYGKKVIELKCRAIDSNPLYRDVYIKGYTHFKALYASIEELFSRNVVNNST
jgi:xylulokinase